MSGNTTLVYNLRQLKLKKQTTADRLKIITKEQRK